MTAGKGHVSMRYRHIYLLLALLLLLMLRPFIDAQVMGLTLVDLLLTLTLVTAALATTEQPFQRITVIGLVGLTMGIRIATGDTSELIWRMTSAGITAAFLGFVTVAVLRDVFLRSSDVSTDTICGALSGYLLLGFLWSFAYAMLELAVPGSFDFSRSIDFAPGNAEFDRFIGFSFITLTTLGYGNIVPTTHQGDALASGEALVGQVYLTVLVARLVALNLQQRFMVGRGTDSVDEDDA